jgi:thiol-disulfide isomerase/thioredoxin
MGCAAVKPVVDRFEEQEVDRVRVIRVNVQDAAGRDLGARFGMEFTPTFILFDTDGSEVWRAVGRLDVKAIRARLDLAL